MKITAVIHKETKVDPRAPQNKSHYASLVLFREDGKRYSRGPRYLSGYQEVADLLAREADMSHERLQEFVQRYESGNEVRLPVTIEDESAIVNMGFDLSVE